jgi:hypothetical protein
MDHGQPVPFDSSASYALAHFRNWNVSNATARSGSVSGVISTFAHDQLTMIDSAGHAMAQPGSLNASGNGFTTTWLAGS